MGYVTARAIKQHPPGSGLGFDPFGLWRLGPLFGKSDEQKAAETIANINQAVNEFKEAHQKAVALYWAGLLSDKLREKHVELRDDLNGLLIKLFDAVSPEEYLEIHNYLARVREDVGLGLAPLLIIGGIALVAAAMGGAITVNRAITSHNKDLENEMAKIEMVQSGIAPVSILEEKEGGSFFEKLFGIDPMMIGAAVLAIAMAPTAFKYIKRKL